MRWRQRELSHAACGIPLVIQSGSQKSFVPKGYVRDHSRTPIGQGAMASETARNAFREWKQFDLGWLRVANPEARIVPDAIIAVEAHALGLWSLNLSRILVSDPAGVFSRMLYTSVPIQIEHAHLGGILPHPHKDPFDRMLAAQAILEGLTLVSADAVFDSMLVTRLW